MPDLKLYSFVLQEPEGSWYAIPHQGIQEAITSFVEWQKSLYNSDYTSLHVDVAKGKATNEVSQSYKIHLTFHHNLDGDEYDIKETYAVREFNLIGGVVISGMSLEELG